MAQFPKIELTQQGKDIIIAGQNGEKITFTKAALGDGLSNGADINAMTELVHAVTELPLQDFESLGDGRARLRFVMDNNQLEKGFFHREIGVYAKVGDGAEKLYAYTNAGNLADYIPGKESPIASKIIDLYFVVGNAENLTIITENSAYITKLDFEKHEKDKGAHGAMLEVHNADAGAHAALIAAHNKDENAHPDIRKLIKSGIKEHSEKAELDHPDGSVTERKLTDGAVTEKKIAKDAVNTSALKNGAVTTDKLASQSVTTAAIKDKAVTSDRIADNIALRGTPTAPTASAGTRSDQIATTNFVAAAITALVNSSPAALDTLQELAKAIGNDPNFATTILNKLSEKVSKSGDIMSGDLNLGKGLHFTGGVTSAGAWAGNKDTGDPISAQDANLVIGSWYGIAFYDQCEGRVMCGLDVRSGTFRTLGRMEAKAGFTGDLDGSASSIGGYSAKDMRMRASNTSYTVGDIAYSKNLPSWARLECVLAGTTAVEEPAQISTKAVGTLVTDGTVIWIIDDIRDCTQVGTVRGSLYLPAGYIKANGATVRRVDYPRLVTLVNAHNLWTDNTVANAGLFGRGDGSTTMVVPNWTDRMVQYATDGIGAALMAGLPNITGSVNWDDRAGVDNALYRLGSTSGHQELCDGRGSATATLTFDASRSSVIYGRSNTVQPAAIKLVPILRY